MLMLERAAITAGSLRIVCAALLLMLIARVDLLSSGLSWQVPTKTTQVAAEVRCTHGEMRTRTPGLQQRYLQRDLGKRRLHELIE